MIIIMIVIIIIIIIYPYAYFINFQFYPKSGPVAGNTKLEINGTEFGRKWEDVREVSIGDVPCNVSKNDYVIAKR